MTDFEERLRERNDVLRHGPAPTPEDIAEADAILYPPGPESNPILGGNEIQNPPVTPEIPENNPLLGGNEIQGFAEAQLDDVLQSQDVGIRGEFAKGMSVLTDDFSAGFQQFRIARLEELKGSGALQPLDYIQAIVENPDADLGDYYDSATNSFFGVPSDDYILHNGELFPRVITDQETGETEDLSEDNQLINFGRILMGGMLDPLEGIATAGRAASALARSDIADPTLLGSGITPGGPVRAPSASTPGADDALEQGIFDEFGTGGLRGSQDIADDVAVSFDQKPLHMWTPEDFEAAGNAAGIPRLGPATEPVPMQLLDGGEAQIPGGLDGKFTYYDMLSIKSQGIDASQIPPEIHAQLQMKMSRSLEMDKLTDQQVWSGLAFGMTSPNNPLFPNQLAVSRLRGQRAIDELADSITWNFGDEVPADIRAAADKAIAAKFGLGSRRGNIEILADKGLTILGKADASPEELRAAAVSTKGKRQKPVYDETQQGHLNAAANAVETLRSMDADDTGGLGVRGTADYTRVAELAKLFKENPAFFRQKKGEEWPEFAERIFSQVAGLKAKTGSFSVVFQDPVKAGVSAIDRHMAREFFDDILSDPGERLAWQERTVALYNSRKKLTGKKKAVSIAEVSDGIIGESILGEVGKTASAKLRLPDGTVNPNVPAHLHPDQFIVEPLQVEMMGRQYKAALVANQEQAMQHGLGIFSSQWMLWDRMRRRVEPHENMFPGLEKMPRPSLEQARISDDAHRASGHKNYSKETIDEEAGEFRLAPTKPGGNPSRYAYLSIPMAMMAMRGIGSEDVGEDNAPR